MVAARRNGDKLAGLVQEIQSKGDQDKLCTVIDLNQAMTLKKLLFGHGFDIFCFSEY